jgi:DNA-binding NtrC family response regulator
MTTTWRDMLYLMPSTSSAVPQDEIRSAGWNLHIAPDVRGARELLARHEFRVGLALFDRPAPVNLELEEFIPSCGSMRWVALVDPSCLELQGLRRLLLETFYDYHRLPADPERLLVTLGHAYGMAVLDGHPRPMPAGLPGEHEMVGTSAVMQELFRNIRKVAGVDAPVLIAGESGTGKELAARAIHERSARSAGPFVAVNCGALPPTLIQSELFGHEKGAFTGAHQRKLGRIEAASGGTVFLDEIGDLSLDLQVNLLRFLQEQTIERVGSAEPIAVDVRVIAATHVDLERAVAEGRFREDLYYRLNVLHLPVPPLRERHGDIEVLARFFFDKFSRDANSQLKGFSRRALQLMDQYPWPGNVRELINRTRRAVVMCENHLITPADLGLESPSAVRRNLTLEEARAEAEREVIGASLRRTRHNVSQAARELGVSRVTLYRLMAKFGLGWQPQRGE